MSEGGNWSGWNPERRPDEPYRQPSTPGPTDRQDPPAEPPRYEPPRYEQPRYDQPTQQQPSYGQPPPPYGQPGQQGQPSGYPPPSYQQPTQQQPTYGAQPGYGPYQQPTQQVPTQGHPDAQDTQFLGLGALPPHDPYGPPPTPAKGRSGGRLALVLGLVVVLVAGLAVGAWALFLRGGPAVTWQGKEVDKPEQVLSTAQGDLDRLVSDNKGVKDDATRCYFSVASDPTDDAAKTNVGDTVYCGPALFVDGDTSKAYVPYGITASSTDPVTLTVTTPGTPDGATAVPSGQKLVRPDGQTPPDGAGGLSVPEPPPAEADTFVAVDDLEVPAAPAGARMGALDGGVVIEKLGEVTRYGTGKDARSAPEGQKLIAFQLGDSAGDGASNGLGVLDLTVTVDGGAGQKIPDPSGINVIAVPTDAKSVDLVTGANGITQSLSLLDGKPGSGNLAVLSRGNRLGTIAPPGSFSFTETGGGASADRPCTLAGSVVGLFYWADDKGTASASSPGNAILETDLKYTFTTDSPPPFTGSNAGDTAIFEPSHLSLTLSDGTVIPAKTLADRTVFEVPAGFTSGTITVGGAFTNTNGITFTVAAPVSFPVSIPAS